MAIIEVNSENFDEVVLKSDQKVLVDFNADWCGPCKMLRPMLEETADGDDQHKFVSVNIDDEDELAEKYEVSSIPCLVVFENGEEAARSVGLKAKDEIVEMLGEN